MRALPSLSLLRLHILFSLSLSWPWSRPWVSQLTKLITNWILSRARENFSSQAALCWEKKLIYTTPAGNHCVALSNYALFWRKAFRRSVNQIKLDSCMQKDLFIFTNATPLSWLLLNKLQSYFRILHSHTEWFRLTAKILTWLKIKVSMVINNDWCPHSYLCHIPLLPPV